MKKCNKCSEEKPLTEFGKNKSRKDGFTYKCKSCINKYSKNQYKNNKEQYKKTTKKWRENNKEQDNESHKKYRENNKEYYKEYSKNRYQNDPQFKLKSLLRVRIYQSIKNKSNSSIDLLGCDIETYYNYLEKQFSKDMTWGNHGEVWEIDHIKPLNTFNLEDENNHSQAFNYKNTRPLLITENRNRPNDGSDLI
jgi:hypothetical protein